MNEPYLSKIESPKDLKKLSIAELEQLAEEIRQKIIDVMAINGGHLGSNLGIVELTIALHKVFDSPDDKFIFDVSHQTYPHKIITGRLETFAKIRQYKGLCGFASPKESPHDHFYAGHAGTALSLGLGVAKNRDLLGREEYILPVIGDASLTCGLVSEALNNIPPDLKRFILVLNDNNMSISKNVGAITHILNRLLNSPTSNKIYSGIEKFFSSIPNLGKGLIKGSRRVRESVKNLISCAAFFEQYGLSYIGPIDGHNISKLIAILEALKESPRPILLHVHTVKGKGMESAGKNPIEWHGCKPFDKVTGKMVASSSAKPTFPKVFGKQILKMAENDPSLVCITPAMPLGSCLDHFMEKFPQRCLDVGIAEGHAVTFAGGIAYGKKMKVVCSIYATFLQRALDNLFQDVCLQELPVVFALDRGGLSPADGSTHHGVYDISFLNAMPNMVICQPRNGHLLKELLESAFSWGRPTAIRYPNLPTEEPELPIQRRELGTAEILHSGEEIAIIALGHMCTIASEVRDILVAEGLNPTVIDPVFVKPLDTEVFYDILMTHKMVITLEEHSVNAGFGIIFNSFAIRNGFQSNQILNFGIPEMYVDQGTHKELLLEIGLDAESIARKILKELSQVCAK
ncbi:MAG TPA: 1-deoxy-D-xylulose-5-phosphate synthase [Rhabdochlamydiaceae bacterium]|nr:1-deoxy-D-xylulose-5-phosphate synthase [Rhabdochlamydiaceae bacterium]